MYAPKRELEADVAQRARAQRQRRDGEEAAEREVGDRAGAGDQEPPAPRLEPGVRRVDEAVREDRHELDAGALHVAAAGGDARPCASSWRRDQHEAPGEEDGAAEADVRRHDERRAVAARDQVRRRRARRRSRWPGTPCRPARVTSAAAALAVDRRRSAGPAHGTTSSRGRNSRARRPPGSCRSRVPVTPASRPRSPRSASSAREPARAGRAELLLGGGDEIDERAAAVEQLEQLGLARGHAHERVRAQVLEDEAALALARVEPLQRPAGAHARPHPELRRRPRDLGVGPSAASSCGGAPRTACWNAVAPVSTSSVRPASSEPRTRSTTSSTSPTRTVPPSRDQGGARDAAAVRRTCRTSSRHRWRAARRATARAARADARRSGRRAGGRSPASVRWSSWTSAGAVFRPAARAPTGTGRRTPAAPRPTP